MNKKQQQLAIAEACGWRDIWEGVPGKFNGKYNNEWHEIPNYLYDLNAMHEAEKTLSDNRHADFREHLCDITYSKKSNQIDRMMDSDRNFISSTAAQRAEAFLKALNLWVE